MNGKPEVKTEEWYEIWSKHLYNDLDGVESRLRSEKDRKIAVEIAKKVSLNPTEFEDILPTIAREVKLGCTLVVRKVTQVSTVTIEDVESFRSHAAVPQK